MRVTSWPTLRAVCPCAVTHSSRQLPLRATASKWTNVVRSVRSSHSPNPLERASAPVRIRPRPRRAPVDPARLGCRSTAGRKPAGLTATGPPVARDLAVPQHPASRGIPPCMRLREGNSVGVSRAEPPECRVLRFPPSTPARTKPRSPAARNNSRRPGRPEPRKPRVGCGRLPR